MNLIQVVMLLSIIGFVITTMKVDHILKQYSIREEVRNKTGIMILALGIIILLFLMIILIRYGK